MAVPATTIFPSSATWNNITWNSVSGGPLRFEWEVAGERFEDWTGDSVFPTFFALVHQHARARLIVREPKCTAPLGTKSDLSFTLKGNANQAVISLPNMVLFGNNGDQALAVGGGCTLLFGHESGDGVQNPIG